MERMTLVIEVLIEVQVIQVNEVLVLVGMTLFDEVLLEV